MYLYSTGPINYGYTQLYYAASGEDDSWSVYFPLFFEPMSIVTVGYLG